MNFGCLQRRSGGNSGATYNLLQPCTLYYLQGKVGLFIPEKSVQNLDQTSIQQNVPKDAI